MIDAEERLRHWMRDYGHTSQRPFVADLEAVLAELDRLRQEIRYRHNHDMEMLAERERAAEDR